MAEILSLPRSTLKFQDPCALSDDLSTLRGDMPRPRLSNALASFGVCILRVWMGLLAVTTVARAEPRGPYFDFDALAEPGYELRLSLGYFSAERSDFSRLLFLVPQPLQSIEVQELRSELDL